MTFQNPTPDFQVKIGSRILSADELRLIKWIDIRLHKRKADTLEIYFWDPDIVLFDNKMFDYGTPVQVNGGWNDEGKTQGPFFIQDLSPDYPESGEVNFVVKCVDRSVAQMSKQDKSRAFRKKKASDVVREIAAEWNLNVEMEIESVDDILFDDEHSLTQSGESDAKLMQRLADKLGYVWGIRDANLYFVRPEFTVGQRLDLHYRSGDRSLKSFKVDMKIWGPGGKKKQGKKFTCNSNIRTKAQRAMVSMNADPKSAVGMITDAFSEEAGKFMNLINGDSDAVNPEQTESRRTDTPGSTVATDTSKTRRPRVESTTRITVDGANNTVFEDVLNSVIPEAAEMIRGDKGQTLPQDKEKQKKHIAKHVRRKLAPVKATMVPTVPSWNWTPFETVTVHGVAKRVAGKYILTEVNLRYDNQRGLTTTLIGKKYTAKQGKNKGKPVDEVTEDQQQNDNPRPTKEKKGGKLGTAPIIRVDGNQNVVHNDYILKGKK